MKRFPSRRFILIGDSGERDPEIYAALARKFPRQVERLHIRGVTGQLADAPRYRKTFDALPAQSWTVFRHPPVGAK
jgi:phosphatidate phosphatase APP1